VLKQAGQRSQPSPVPQCGAKTHGVAGIQVDLYAFGASLLN
jgi:hypothetical protein